MAKVMISIPDKLLKRLDLQAKEAGETRSGFLQRIAAQELERTGRHDREEIERLLAEIQPVDLGGASAAQLIREDRESH